MTADLRATLRLWRRRPVVPALAVLFLGSGMGMAGGIFAVADAALWRSLPLPAADRVIWVQSLDRGVGGDTSPGVFAAWSSRARTLIDVGALRPVAATWRDARGAERLDGAQATAGLFRALGVTAVAGRPLIADDERAGADPVLVLTHRLWQSRFGGDPSVVGRQVDLDGRSRRIVGVLEANADQLPVGGAFFTPLSWSPDALSPGGPRYLKVVGRMVASGATSSTGRELTDIAQSIGAVGSDGALLGAQATPFGRAFEGTSARLLEPLFITSLIVLLIAAMNTANLLIADQHTRRAELAVRAALGAGRGRLIRQLVTESLLVTAVAGLLALLLAQWFTAGLMALLPADLPRLGAASVDGRTAAFVTALVLVVTALVGVAPAIRQTGGTLAGAVVGTARGVVRGDDRFRRAFVMAQIALAMTLGSAGLLMWQTTQALMQAPRGYSPDGVWTAALRLAAGDYRGPAELDAALTRVVSAVAALPGVTDVAVASRVPLAGGAPGSDVALVSEAFAPGTDRQVRIRIVSPGYFRALGVPVIEGRDLTAGDGAGARAVMLVNETLASRLTPGRSPVGQAVKFAVKDFSDAAAAWQVVGLVGDSKDRGPREVTEPEAYISIGQTPAGVFEWIGRQVLLVARSAPGVALSPATLRQAVSAADPRMPAFDVLSLDQRLQRHLSVERLLSNLLAPIAVLGTLLAGFGVFALVMQMVTSRRREIAVRMVLGASPATIVYDTASTGLRLALGGLVFGCLGALAADRLLAASTFGSRAIDPEVLLSVAVLMLMTTLVAVWLPARRAARHDPAEALRAE